MFGGVEQDLQAAKTQELVSVGESGKYCEPHSHEIIWRISFELAYVVGGAPDRRDWEDHPDDRAGVGGRRRNTLEFPIRGVNHFPASSPPGAKMNHWLNYIAVGALSLLLFGMILADTKKQVAIAFSGVLVIVFAINIQFWTFGFALSKLVAGIMSILILVLSSGDLNMTLEETRTGRIFRTVILLFGIVVVLFTQQKIVNFLVISVDQSLPALFMLICGLLMLGIFHEPFRIILGLLLFLSGFEIIYGSVEKSLLINGLLAAVMLFIALVGAYLIMPPSKEKES